MAEFIPWNSQPLTVWADKYAQGDFIDLDGRRTHFIEKGEGKPIILLHGFFYDSCLWATNIDALGEHFKVYALDLWGFGYSTRAPWITATSFGPTKCSCSWIAWALSGPLWWASPWEEVSPSCSACSREKGSISCCW